MKKVYNLKTGSYEVEKTVNEKLLNAVYGTAGGRFWLELLFKRKICSFLFGKFCDTRLSAKMINDFVNRYDIDMSECVKKVNDYKSFNDFFTRRLKPEARKFEQDPVLLLSPGDGRMRAFKNIDINNIVQVKGFSYTVEQLLSDAELAEKYQGGICIILRLSPVDYHRFHFIDGGVCDAGRPIKGFYYSVNPKALNTIPELFCRNKRQISVLKSDNFGDIAYMEVGAALTGTIVQTYIPGTKVSRGDEKGYFKFGGSTILLFLEKDSAAVDERILYQTEIGCEVKVSAGDVIGGKR